MKTYLAHKTEDREQTLQEHLQGTAKLAGDFAAAFGKRSLGEFVGGFHDIGKASKGFQARIRNPNSTDTCDHSTAGALEAVKMRQMTAAMCIMGHHSGLPDLGGQMDRDVDGTFGGALKRDRREESRITAGGRKPVHPCPRRTCRKWILPRRLSADIWRRSFYTRPWWMRISWIRKNS